MRLKAPALHYTEFGSDDAHQSTPFQGAPGSEHTPPERGMAEGMGAAGIAFAASRLVGYTNPNAHAHISAHSCCTDYLVQLAG